jgi:hypothetical protein
MDYTKKEDIPIWLSTSKRGNTRKPYKKRISSILFFYTAVKRKTVYFTI